jgi:hypothetical protein
MRTNTRVAGRGTIREAPESADESIMKMRFDHGLCVTCSAKIFEVTETGGRRKLNPVTTPGVSMHGRCLYCHPEKESHNPVKEEEDHWEDDTNVPVEGVEKGEDIDDQSSPPDIDKRHFVCVVTEGNTKKGKGIFSHIEETGEHKGKSIVYEGEFVDGFFEGHGSLRREGTDYDCEGEWKKSKLHGYSKMTFESGHTYEGEMQIDMRDGQGTYTWANGDRYEGEWKNDMRNGSGKRFYKVGQIYEGNWKDGKIDGQGTFKWDMATIMNWSGRRIM